MTDEEDKAMRIAQLEWELKKNDIKMIEYIAGLRTAEQHATDVEERVQIYQEIEKEKKG